MRTRLTGLLLIGTALSSGSIAAPVAQLAASPSTPPDAVPFMDRYLAEGTSPLDISYGDSITTDPSGLARQITLEGVTSALSDSGARDSGKLRENGLIFDSQWDTESHGAWTADLAVRDGDPGLRGSARPLVRVSEHAMPFGDGWNADASAGDVSGINIDLARFQTRFFLPTAPLLGITTQWRGPSGTQFVAGGGEPGLYEGIQVPAFDTLGGTTAGVGGQWSPAPQWTVGGQVVGARDVHEFASLPLEAGPDYGERLSSTTGFLSAAWHNADARAQLNLLDGTTAGGSNASGAWLDVTTLRGQFSQNAGLFRIDPGLSWGNQRLTSDLQGAYYQLGLHGRRWFADVDIDQAWSVSGRGVDTTFLTSDARYQLTRDFGFGGVLNVRRADGFSGESLQGYVDRRNDWGLARCQASYAASGDESGATFVLSQDWDVHGGAHLSAAIGYERITSATHSFLGPTNSDATVSINATGNLNARLSVDANIRWALKLTGQGAPAIAANIAFGWQIAQNWSLRGTYYEARTGSWTDLTVDSPLTPPTATVNPALNERGVFVSLRYRHTAGQHFAPLGGTPTSGSGGLSGTVYLDANDNRRFDAGEAVAPNVTVVLDGRYSVVTDDHGRFDFHAVASGSHVLTIVPDGIPLPWSPVNDGRVTVEVRTRDHTDVGIPLVRQSILTREVQ